MFFKIFFNAFRNGGGYPGILVLMLGIMTGPALGQDSWGMSAQPEVAALSAVLMNPATGEVLFAKEPHLRLPPASTTKVLTALLVLERLDLNARVLVSPQAASAPPSRIGLRAGEAALAQDLLYGLMLKSGNDAAETLAEAAGGSIYGFAELMNTKAWQIGARNSHFMNPHGLPNDDHYSTAYDLALIFRQAMNHPMFADIVRTRNAALRIEKSQGLYGDWRMVPVVNHNRLLSSYEGTLGGKTGFTLKARRCFVGEVDRGGVRLIVAILNSPTSGALWRDARALLDYGFAHYGVVSPPPVPVEPLPVLVQREPVVSPDEEESDEPPMVRPAPVTRIAMTRPSPRVEAETPKLEWQREPEPVVVESPLPAKPAVAADTQRIVKANATVRPVALPAAKPMVAARPVATPVVAKPVMAARPVAKPVMAARPVAKPVMAARPVATPVAAKPTKSIMLAMNTAKPMAISDKGAKPIMASSGKAPAKPTPVASTRLEKREITKVAVRTEPAAKSQKTRR